MLPLRKQCALLAAIGCIALVSATSAAAESVARLRVMLHPYTAAPGVLPPEALALLVELAGSSLALTGTTRTGALELALPAPVDAADAIAMVKRLRVDRSVLWAEPILPAPAKAKAADDTSGQTPGRRFMVRIKDGVTPDWPSLLGRLGARIGLPLKAERQIGNIWILSVAYDQSVATLAQFAELIQGDTDIQYADPVRHVTAQAAPNDPFYSRQWYLTSALAGINVETAWTLQPTSPNIVVAVIDTGILPHPDLVGRVLPGYDFISDPNRARDGNARDPNPRDEGDWSQGECGFLSDSFFHGLFVSGLIAANTNNDIGIAGVADGVQILPVRTLGVCGGTFEDVLEGMMWASGVRIAGVPVNTTPAKVINMSLGGLGDCDQSIQEAVNDALAQGAVVVTAAGNSFEDARNFTPTNCSGVISVGAHTAQASITSYSNYGQRIDLTAPGGDYPVTDLILGLSNDGITVPRDPDYVYAAGTSFAAPLVSGTAAMMLARNPLLTAGNVLDIITGTTRGYPGGSFCTVPNLCGSGMLDAGAAIGSTLPGGGAPPPNAFQVVEYYRSDLDHYFITADPAEIKYVDTVLSGIFKRTGLYFYAYLNPAVAPKDAQPVCRYYASAAVQINSHYYSGSFLECVAVAVNWPGIWQLESAHAFYIQVPDALGRCPAKTLPVYRFFDNRRDANHRYTVDLS
ncbi:MAG: S8 family peptidase, partial [Casimicrobiaceae bacterium]